MRPPRREKPDDAPPKAPRDRFDRVRADRRRRAPGRRPCRDGPVGRAGREGHRNERAVRHEHLRFERRRGLRIHRLPSRRRHAGERPVHGVHARRRRRRGARGRRRHGRVLLPRAQRRLRQRLVRDVQRHAGRPLTYDGVLCSPLSTQGCTVEVVAFDAGSPAGVGQVFTIPGSVGQQSLAALLPGSAEKSKLALRFRMLTGAGLPYAIKNDNLTSDGSNLSLSVSRGAFSTAPVIASFTISPSSGCSPLTVTATWSTTGADHVNITGAAGDLATSGTATFTVVSAGDITLTAVTLSGATTTSTRKITLQAPANPPTPTPSTATVGMRQVVTGSIPVAYTGTLVTITFDKHDSTGSTFTVNGNQFTYTAGSATGTDVVRLTVPGGACGPATATFTATVIVPGDPAIIFFTADPARGCGSSTNVILSWQTENASQVTINPVTAPFGLAPNGSGCPD